MKAFLITVFILNMYVVFATIPAMVKGDKSSVVGGIVLAGIGLWAGVLLFSGAAG